MQTASHSPSSDSSALLSRGQRLACDEAALLVHERHLALAHLIDHVEGRLDEDVRVERADEADCAILALDIARLMGLVTRHLARNGEHLYPVLGECAGAEGRRLVERLRGEARGLSGIAHVFTRRWSGGEHIRADRSSFRIETRLMLGELRAWLDREDELLAGIGRDSGEGPKPVRCPVRAPRAA
ncbi:hypothetical protein [Sphingomicrobium nitratireducens]|uniref:hypothetical protein n=1 Tax=Sphingomicrobium nitratireducens TaxID=2964666 RepID=UPI00223F45B3|nr:hypothetical protein [Sphingomicrobium nitratireducens]